MLCFLTPSKSQILGTVGNKIVLYSTVYTKPFLVGQTHLFDLRDRPTGKTYHADFT